MRCEELSDDLAAAADGSVLLGRTERRHVERCLRCQAEMVQYRKVLRAMRAMRTEVLEPAPGLLSDILANLEEAGERRAIRSMIQGHRAAYLGGLAAATAAGAAGAVFYASRTRRLRAASADLTYPPPPCGRGSRRGWNERVPDIGRGDHAGLAGRGHRPGGGGRRHRADRRRHRRDERALPRAPHGRGLPARPWW